MKELLNNLKPQQLRERYIESLAGSNDATETAKNLAANLFALDLTVYSREYSFESILYNVFAKSCLDHTIALHPEQLQIVYEIKNKEALIVSAPTSFGKTFSIFEYIARESPNNIVMVVPTLALVDEYMRKIIKKYRNFFAKYKVYTQLDRDNKCDFQKYNIFILTHDRVIQDEIYETIDTIDLLVIDEVYKLETDPTNDRVLVLNMAYYYLARKAKKYVLLAPFVKNIEDIELLEKKPYFYCTDYSPVVNKINVIDILRAEDRASQCSKLLVKIDPEEKTLVYFPTVRGLYNYIEEFIVKENVLDDIDENVQLFIEWAKDEIHEDWCVVNALEHGYAVHNGQIPLGIRSYLLYLYENNSQFNRLLCTSTLLEGVNTSAKNIIITSPSRRSFNKDSFSAFDFYNLVGRTGRLNQHLIGKAYYLRAPTDPIYTKTDAIRSIRFEITDNSPDIDIQKGLIDKHENYKAFLELLGIDHEAYLKNIGNHFRFNTVQELFNKYKAQKFKLEAALQNLFVNTKSSKWELIHILYNIFEAKDNKFKVSIINNLINRSRPKLRDVIEISKEKSSNNINDIISTAIQLKISYIEHMFYPKLMLVKFFMSLDKFSDNHMKILDEKVTNTIEQLYFTNSKQRRMLLDIGIYERDIDSIINVIGNEFTDISEMKQLIISNSNKFHDLGFISRYIIRNI